MEQGKGRGKGQSNPVACLPGLGMHLPRGLSWVGQARRRDLGAPWREFQCGQKLALSLDPGNKGSLCSQQEATGRGLSWSRGKGTRAGWLRDTVPETADYLLSALKASHVLLQVCEPWKSFVPREFLCWGLSSRHTQAGFNHVSTSS